MSSSTLEFLAIDQELKSRLNAVLAEFESYRVGRDLSKKEDKNTTTEEVEVKKRKKVSLLKRLFLTEYA